MAKNKIVIANHKMNMLSSDINIYLKKIKEQINIENVIICPSCIYIPYFLKQNFKVGIQNIFYKSKGAYTGEISPRQAKSMEVDYAIVGHSERRKYFLETNNEINQKIDLIKRDLSLDQEIPKEYIYADEFLIRAYLRGLFLSSGSINDPKKSQYHLEFIVDNLNYAKFISKLLNKFNLKSKYLKRENKYMVYIKEAEKISDFLRIMNATNSLFYYEDIRIYRDHKNMTNRLNNCEQANIDKVIETATKQIKEINKIKKIGGLELLDEKTKEVAIYRLKYPDVSLVELSEIISIETGKQISKSGIYHRFNKIKEMAKKIKED